MGLINITRSVYPRCTAANSLRLFTLALVGNALAPWLSVHQYFNWFYSRTNLVPEKRRYWLDRVNRLMACPLNAEIPRVPHSGRLKNGRLIMHNGILVDPSSFYGIYGLLLLHCNRGVHEPQEEIVFGRVLAEQREGAVMLELGAYWSFYSLWFHGRVIRASCLMVEPISENLEAGKRNFALNGLRGQFIQAYVGDGNGQHEDGTRIVGVDDFLREQSIEFLDILHSDIQGSELQMLNGAAEALRNRRIGWLFVSTHTNDLHADCERLLVQAGYEILASINRDASYSEDGILVARRPEVGRAHDSSDSLCQRWPVAGLADQVSAVPPVNV
jgi:hypothetical protein